MVGLPVFVWLVLSAIWGTSWLMIKLGLRDMPPFTFAIARFVVALIPLIIWSFLRKGSRQGIRKELPLVWFTGFLVFGLNYGLVFWAEIHITSGMAAVLYTVLPLYGVFVSHFYKRTELFRAGKLLGILLGIAGVTVIFHNQLRLESPMAVWGGIAILVAAFGTCWGGVLTKAHLTHLDPIVLTTGQMLSGMVPILLAGLMFEPFPQMGQWTPAVWLLVAYLGIFGTATTFVLLNWLIGHMDVTKTQLIPLGSTLLAIFLGWLVLDEPVTTATTVGGFCLLSGLTLASTTKNRV